MKNHYCKRQHAEQNSKTNMMRPRPEYDAAMTNLEGHSDLKKSTPQWAGTKLLYKRMRNAKLEKDTSATQWASTSETSSQLNRYADIQNVDVHSKECYWETMIHKSRTCVYTEKYTCVKSGDMYAADFSVGIRWGSESYINSFLEHFPQGTRTAARHYLVDVRKQFEPCVKCLSRYRAPKQKSPA